jgi:hypothetical protein
MAASAAAILLESPVCDTRWATSATVILFHGVRSGAQGKTGDIADNLKLLRDLDLAMATIVGPRLGLTPAEYLARIDRRDWWMGADEALAQHALDGVIPMTAVSAQPALVGPEAKNVKAEPVVPAQSVVPSRTLKERLLDVVGHIMGSLLRILAAVRGIPMAAWELLAAASLGAMLPPILGRLRGIRVTIHDRPRRPRGGRRAGKRP